jgi:hypothetical protein
LLRWPLSADPRQFSNDNYPWVPTVFVYEKIRRRDFAAVAQQASHLTEEEFALREYCVIELCEVMHCEAFSATSAPTTYL